MFFYLKTIPKTDFNKKKYRWDDKSGTGKESTVEFVELIPEDTELLVEYLLKYANHYKISAEETIERYKDGEKFANDFERWKAKYLKK